MDFRATATNLPAASAALREDTRQEVALEHYNRRLQGDTRLQVASPRHTATHRSGPHRVFPPLARVVEDIPVQVIPQAGDLLRLDMHPPPLDRSLPSLHQVKPALVLLYQEFPKLELQPLLQEKLLESPRMTISIIPRIFIVSMSSAVKP